MVMFLRHVLSIAILPFTVTVLVPAWLNERFGPGLGLGSTIAAVVVQGLGVALLLGGVALFAASLRRFASDGEGTLAPWDPPRRLVVRGPYRYVRNPMISGVLFVLIGEAMVLRSDAHAIWAASFLIANVLVITLYEEPRLAQVFGDSYRTYRAHVPRVVPRMTAWRPPDDTPAT
jgi:protein-S-isoprenylcysteine O-methyltransferase Ste14